MNQQLIPQNACAITCFFSTVPPEQVTITGSSTATVGETLTYRCQAYRAHPPPKLTWTVNGRRAAGTATSVHVPTSGKYGDVTSDLDLEVRESDSRISVTCMALSSGHYGDTMTRKAEKEIVVLSKFRTEYYSYFEFAEFMGAE